MSYNDNFLTSHMSLPPTFALLRAGCFSSWKMAAQAQVRDRIGRLRKEYLPRHDPVLKWRDEKFIAKYRLSRDRVKILGREFSESGFSRNKGTNVGGGLSHTQQVGYVPHYG